MCFSYITIRELYQPRCQGEICLAKITLMSLMDWIGLFFSFLYRQTILVVWHSFIRLITLGVTYSAHLTRHISSLLLNKYVFGYGIKWATLSLLLSRVMLHIILCEQTLTRMRLLLYLYQEDNNERSAFNVL